MENTQSGQSAGLSSNLHYPTQQGSGQYQANYNTYANYGFTYPASGAAGGGEQNYTHHAPPPAYSEAMKGQTTLQQPGSIPLHVISGGRAMQPIHVVEMTPQQEMNLRASMQRRRRIYGGVVAFICCLTIISITIRYAVIAS